MALLGWRTGRKLNADPRIAFFLPSLRGGGVEKNVLRLAGALAERGHPVDIVITRPGGDYQDAVPPGVRVHVLQPAGVLSSRLITARSAGVRLSRLLRPVLLPWKSSRILRHIAGLADYLDRERPQALIAAMSYPNIVAVCARHRSATQPALILTERNTLSQTLAPVRHQWRWRYLPLVIRTIYPQADHVVAVSGGVADDLAATTGLSRDSIRTIYNPVVSPAIAQGATIPPSHPWFAHKTTPVIIGIGRLVAAKRFDLLIRAFAQLRAQTPARLLILGEGHARESLETLIRDLGISANVDMPGFVDNPYPYLAHADLFVLSSDYEGLPTVLIEALACGATVVATDCPSGPREILDAGRFGRLVACNDGSALNRAMRDALQRPARAADQQCRAQLFSMQRSVDRYRSLCLETVDAATPKDRFRNPGRKAYASR